MYGLDAALDVAWERYCDEAELDPLSQQARADADAAMEEQSAEIACGQAHLDLGAAARNFEAGGFHELAKLVRATMKLAALQTDKNNKDGGR